MSLRIIETSQKAELDEVFSIRRVVFVEEQAVDPAEEYDEYESSSRHFLLLTAGEGVATSRFRSTDKGWKIERMAVLKNARGHGYGAKLLAFMLQQIPQDGRPRYLHAQEHALAFYQKAGFVAEGNRFFEANIPHFKMVYRRASD